MSELLSLFEVQHVANGGIHLVRPGRNPFKINGATAALYQALRTTSSLDAAFEMFSASDHARDIGHAEFAALTKRFVIRLAEPESNLPKFPWLWAKFTVIPSPISRVLAMPLECMFHRLIFILFCTASLFIIARFMMMQPGGGFAQIELVPIQFYLLACLANLLLHELAHIAACARFGIATGGIQAGLFIFIPATFIEIPSLWSTSAARRMMVNFGGVYIQLVFAAGLLICYEFSRSNLTLNAAAISLSLSTFQLVPFRRSDGYWMIRDLIVRNGGALYRDQATLTRETLI